jgi:hypothetical protein
MKKHLLKGQDRESLKPLHLHKETLRRLEASELREAEGGGSASFCAGTWTCCQLN